MARWSDAEVPLTLAEARAIARRAAAGELNTRDVEIRRIVDAANRMQTRALLAGRDDDVTRQPTDRRAVVAGCLAVVVVGIAGILVPIVAAIAALGR
ncbi:hypothetical protein [Schumannella soli]|uniref:Uncharacterized protein n=1 Tax=Schumannella soli TaxID=2590779 RepID=A0A506XXK7_9MICO|nr:hypothetical protein [Schumannella soli]TPW77501.1 hypothetical protein FJ657_02125 [Schumannella soli]